MVSCMMIHYRIFFRTLMGMLQKILNVPKRDFVYITMSLAVDPRPYSSGPLGCTGGSDKVKPPDLLFSK